MADYSQVYDQLPFDLEAEQSVLGAVLVDPACMTTLLEYIKPEQFYKDQHRELFGIMMRMFTLGQTMDFITILNQAKLEHIFESDEQAKVYLTQLVQIVPTTRNVDAYAKIVQERFYVRSLMLVARDIISEASEGEGDARTLLDRAEQRIYEIRQGKDATGLTPISDVIISTYDRLQRLSSEDKSDYLGLPSGFSGLDRVIMGLNKSDLLLVAARPGMGKTSFAMNIAQYVGEKTNKSVAIFNLEMTKEQLVSRMLSSAAEISSMSLKTGNLQGSEWSTLAEAAGRLSRTNIYIDDNSNITVPEMRAKLRRVKDLGLVVIDYLQLMSTGRRSENRVQEVSEITRNLKIMAKDLNVPVITLSQLSRGPDSRSDNHRPILSDLRESGSIEQDADIVLFLYRDAYYNPESQEQNIAECIVAKNRHGETGTVKLYWDGQYTRFSSLELNRDEG